MSINKTYAVFGLGRYGRAVATELVKSGAEVLAFDKDEGKVNDMASDFPICKCADVTDNNVIERLGISNVDVVIIAMAGNMEASILATMLCKEAGVPTVITKCLNEMHSAILQKVGADRVVFPERESGIRLAKNLLSSGFIDMAELSDGISIVELDIRDEWVGKNLIQLRLRDKYGVNVIAVLSDGGLNTVIDPSKPLAKAAKLIVIANTEKLKRLK